MINTIIKETSEFSPVVYTRACEEYPTLAPGDVVVDYSFDLALFFENGHYAIIYRDRVEEFDDPFPALRLLLPDIEGTWVPFETN